MSHGPGGPLSWPGSAAHPLPLWQATLLCLSPLHQLPGLRSLTLPQHYASMEKKKEKREREKKRTSQTVKQAWNSVFTHGAQLPFIFKWKCFVRPRSHSDVLTKGPGSEWKRWVVSSASSLRDRCGENVPSEHLTKVSVAVPGHQLPPCCPRMVASWAADCEHPDRKTLQRCCCRRAAPGPASCGLGKGYFLLSVIPLGLCRECSVGSVLVSQMRTSWAWVC